LEYAIEDLAKDDMADQLMRQLQTDAAFKAVRLDTSEAPLSKLVAEERYKLAVVIPEDFSRRIQDTGEEADAVLQVILSPTLKPYLKQLFTALLQNSVAQLRMQRMFAERGDSNSEALLADLAKVNLNIAYAYADGANTTHTATPSSVQQNVPAWLIFAMFFVIIPISTAFIIEKQQGTFVRLRLMNISALNLMLAKLAPYYVVNQIQMAGMILVGRYVVPLLGGGQLNWPGSLAGLIIISSAASIAAIGFALLIATIAKTTVQATTTGGVINIIFGALGGIMVPKFVMPTGMQELTPISPMSWGLEGFLDVFLRQLPWTAVLPEALALLGFGAACLVGATLLFKRLV